MKACSKMVKLITILQKRYCNIFISLQSTPSSCDQKEETTSLKQLGWNNFNSPETGANMYRQVLMSLLKTSVFLDKV